MKDFDVCKETQKERTKTLDGLTSGEAYIWGLKSRIISLFANRRAYIRGYNWGVGGFNVRFYRIKITKSVVFIFIIHEGTKKSHGLFYFF